MQTCLPLFHGVVVANVIFYAAALSHMLVGGGLKDGGALLQSRGLEWSQMDVLNNALCPLQRPQIQHVATLLDEARKLLNVSVLDVFGAELDESWLKFCPGGLILSPLYNNNTRLTYHRVFKAANNHVREYLRANIVHNEYFDRCNRAGRLYCT